MARTGKEQLQDQLVDGFGKKQGLALYKKYSPGLPHGYIDDCPLDLIVSDIGLMEQLSNDNPLTLRLEKIADVLHLRLFQWKDPISLSDILPILENFDLRTDRERPYQITTADNDTLWISDFVVEYQKAELALDKVKELFQDAFSKINSKLVENDGFNKLILGASLSWREVMILRTYAKYLRQVGFRFSQAYIEKTLVNHTDESKDLVALFLVRHDPSQTAKAASLSEQIEKRINKTLESIASLDEDQIIRRLLQLIKATLRTNYFQLNAQHQLKSYLSLKLNSRTIPDMPLPTPLYEIFVYSPRFEAIHLRNTKVARGGIRWSDRREDFRTEILGLMKAQTVKNSIIVPSGAKGGFVLKTTEIERSREQLQAEVVACYQSFIRGLLDLTDNLQGKKIIHPKQVVCYDDHDPYLVVAADKGTATFSDMANAISKEYGFWMGDAFASGGKTGYDHKAMGITARGAWESIKRHFRELDINVEITPISVIGIGDMSGDVFGNGMLYTKQIKLVAAFDHRHIFLDPNPDTLTSYKERARLFELPTSSWEDYSSALISKGGGVFKRSLKTITLTAAIKRLLSVEEDMLTPNELIRAILRAPVELLFNGGIGTYVKSSHESQADVMDRTNDYCRVNGNELRCKVVGEGGNLGFTQLGRVEYALNGGLINTDSIDNSAGVDCSDHEVNLKILLDNEIQKGGLAQAKRNPLLASVTDEVAQLVLNDNYAQALVMSFTAFHAKKNIALHTNYIKELEGLGILNRQVDGLPDEKGLLERKAAGLGLTRPELAILLAYTKIHIKHEILKSNLLDDPFLSHVFDSAFPAAIMKKYSQAMTEHKLRLDIIATQLSNQVVNEMGITFVYRLQMETSSSIAEIIRAHAVASHVFETPALEKVIEALDFKIPMAEQYEILYNIRNLINLAARWFLHDNHLKGELGELIAHYSDKVKTLEGLVPELMGGFTKNYLTSLTESFLKIGLPKEVAQRVAGYRAIYTALNIIEVSTKHEFDLIQTAKVYFAAGERVNLLWFRDQIANDSREGHWNVLARLTLRDELDMTQRALTVAILRTNKKAKNATALIDNWVNNNQLALARWDKVLAMLHDSGSVEYTMFFIAIRELISIITTCQ